MVYRQWYFMVYGSGTLWCMTVALYGVWQWHFMVYDWYFIVYGSGILWCMTVAIYGG